MSDPTRTLKLRLLNGAHSAIAYLGALLGLPFVADVMADPALARFVERLMLEEIAPLTATAARLRRGWLRPGPAAPVRNPSLQHRTLQIAMDGSQKIPVRWLPVLREGRRRGLPCPHLVLALAAWLRFLAVTTRPGERCRSTTRWRAACARSWRRSRTTRRPWSGPSWASRKCSAATCRRTPRSSMTLTTALERLTQAGARAALG